MACAGFILAGAEIHLRGGRLAPEGREKNFCPPVFFSAPPAEFNYAPPAEFDFAPPADSILPPLQNSILPPGQDWQEGGQKTLLYLEKEGETFNNRSLSKLQLTVLFFF